MNVTMGPSMASVAGDAPVASVPAPAASDVTAHGDRGDDTPSDHPDDFTAVIAAVVRSVVDAVEPVESSASDAPMITAIDAIGDEHASPSARPGGLDPARALVLASAAIAGPVGPDEVEQPVPVAGGAAGSARPGQMPGAVPLATDATAPDQAEADQISSTPSGQRGGEARAAAVPADAEGQVGAPARTPGLRQTSDVGTDPSNGESPDELADGDGSGDDMAEPEQVGGMSRRGAPGRALGTRGVGHESSLAGVGTTAAATPGTSGAPVHNPLADAETVPLSMAPVGVDAAGASSGIASTRRGWNASPFGAGALGGQRLTIDASDETLGRLTIHASTERGAINLHLMAEEDRTRSALEQQRSELRDELESAGVPLGDLDVTDGGAFSDSDDEHSDDPGASRRTEDGPGPTVSTDTTNPRVGRGVGDGRLDLHL